MYLQCVYYLVKKNKSVVLGGKLDMSLFLSLVGARGNILIKIVNIYCEVLAGTLLCGMTCV